MMMISSVWLSMRACYCCQRPLAVPKRTAVPEVGGGPKLIGFANLVTIGGLPYTRGESHRGFSTCQHLAGPSPIFRRSWRTCSGAQAQILASGRWRRARRRGSDGTSPCDRFRLGVAVAGDRVSDEPWGLGTSTHGRPSRWRDQFAIAQPWPGARSVTRGRGRGPGIRGVAMTRNGELSVSA
jgi:hypothetical protein